MKTPFVMFETNDFMLVYKPPFWKMDTSTNYSLNNIKTNNFNVLHVWIGQYLRKHTKIKPAPPNYNCVHRYDIQTSGAIIVAKKKETIQPLMKLIADKKNMTKIYLTLVIGACPDNGYIIKNIKCDLIKNKYYFCSTVDYDSSGIKYNEGQYACSYFHKLCEYEYNNNKYSLVHVRIFTGRTHQIRVHMQSIGHPVFCDYKYIDKELLLEHQKIINRTFLHNISLRFNYNNNNYNFNVPVPNDLMECLSKLHFINSSSIKYLQKRPNLYNFDKQLLISSCKS